MFHYKYDYSIVMAYYNRKTQTERTLDKFEEIYKNYSYEVIIVDDNSKPDHDLTELIKKYSFPIKLHDYFRTRKRWTFKPLFCIQ